LAREPVDDTEFTEFVRSIEPRLRRGLIASYGPERGREATAEALAWAWENRSRLQQIKSPVAFLFRVGQSLTRPPKRRILTDRPHWDERIFEPRLSEALSSLPERQRGVVMLVHGAGWTHAEVAEALRLSTSTVQKHVERGTSRLRQLLEIDPMNLDLK
jgi:DNA-directed RNA polymerase specialized sigma24 family protein